MLLFLFFVLSVGCVKNRTIFLSCFELFDADHDSIITPSEISNLLNLHGLNNTVINGPVLISNCDMNGDGVFTENGDWHNTTSCLLYPDSTPNGFITCNYCKLVGWTNPEETKK